MDKAAGVRVHAQTTMNRDRDRECQRMTWKLQLIDYEEVPLGRSRDMTIVPPKFLIKEFVTYKKHNSIMSSDMRMQQES